MKKCFVFFSVFVTTLLYSSGVFSQKPDSRFNEALALKDQNKWEESMAIFSQLLKSDSSNIDYLTNTSYLFCKIGNRQTDESARLNYFKKAEYLSKKAVALNYNSAQAHYNYALALNALGQTDQARLEFIEAANLAPGDKVIWDSPALRPFGSPQAQKGPPREHPYGTQRPVIGSGPR